MSTAVLIMQSLAPHRRNTDLSFDVMSKAAPTCGTANQWTSSSSSQEGYSYMSTPEYTGFPITSTQADIPFTLHSSVEPQNLKHQDPNYLPILDSSLNDFKTRNNTSTNLQLHTTGIYPSPAMFTASNAHAAPHDQATVSPLDTRFDVDYASPRSDAKPSFDSQMHNMPSSNHPTHNYDLDHSSPKGRCDSLQSNFESQISMMPQVGRRRGSEYAEPGSARAIYLEKNRKAASKCRSKQKRQQEELVESARDVERRNKILKAEVSMLKGDMRDLMELVGQHSNCPDARLKLYVQREADRLASRGSSQLSPLSGGSFSGPPSTDKGSTPDGD